MAYINIISWFSIIPSELNVVINVFIIWLFRKVIFTYSNKIAVQTEGIEYSYKKVYENSLLLSSKISSFDLIDQSRVAILLSNRNEYWEAIVGINHSNMIAVPINSNLNHIQINHIIKDADIKIIITESVFKDKMPLKKSTTSFKCIL